MDSGGAAMETKSLVEFVGLCAEVEFEPSPRSFTKTLGPALVELPATAIAASAPTQPDCGGDPAKASRAPSLAGTEAAGRTRFRRRPSDESLRRHWFSTLEGAKIEVPFELAHPIVIGLAQQTLYLAAYRLHRLGCETAGKSIHHLGTVGHRNLSLIMNGARDELQRQAAELRALVAHARACGTLAEVTYPEHRILRDTLPITSPITRQLLHLFTTSDQLLRDTETLYLHARRESALRESDRGAVKQTLLNAIRGVRTTYLKCVKSVGTPASKR
jgi:hypothetical protein